MTRAGTARGAAPARASLTSRERRATRARCVSTALAEYRVDSVLDAETAAKETEPSGACVAVVVRTTFPSSTISAVTEPAPSSRILSVETREPARYRATVATVAPFSRSIVITARSSPLAYTRVCGPLTMGFSPLQNSITLKRMKSRKPANPYTGMMTRNHVTALRRYLSSTDWLMSYTLRVNWNFPKHPAEKTTPTDTTSTSATTLPRRLFPIFPSLSSDSELDHCKSRRELLQCERFLLREFSPVAALTPRARAGSHRRKLSQEKSLAL